MLLDDAIKIRAAKKLKEEQKPVVVPGIITTREGAKTVYVSLGSDGLKIGEDLSVQTGEPIVQLKEIKKSSKKRKPQKTKKKGK